MLAIFYYIFFLSLSPSLSLARLLPQNKNSTHFFSPSLSLVFFPIFSLTTSFSSICARKAKQPGICARKSKRRNGSQILMRFALELILIMASKTNILPQPLEERVCGFGRCLEEEALVGGEGKGRETCCSLGSC
jgi:hypothetical protein